MGSTLFVFSSILFDSVFSFFIWTALGSSSLHKRLSKHCMSSSVICSLGKSCILTISFSKEASFSVSFWEGHALLISHRILSSVRRILQFFEKFKSVRMLSLFTTKLHQNMYESFSKNVKALAVDQNVRVSHSLSISTSEFAIDELRIF